MSVWDLEQPKREGYVDTAYGPMPGCEICGLIAMTEPLLCEHGVTPPLTHLGRVEMQMMSVDPATYEHLKSWFE